MPKLPAGSSMPPAARHLTETGEDSKAELEESHIPGQPVRRVPYPKAGKSVGGYQNPVTSVNRAKIGLGSIKSMEDKPQITTKLEALRFKLSL